MIIRQEDIDPHPRDVIAEIQQQRLDAVIEREIDGLAQFTGRKFAERVYHYPFIFFMDEEQ